MAKGRPRIFYFPDNQGRLNHARYVKMPESGDPSDVVCLNCVPRNTQMVATFDLIQYTMFNEHDCTTVYECQECSHMYAIQYKAVIDE